MRSPHFTNTLSSYQMAAAVLGATAANFVMFDG